MSAKDSVFASSFPLPPLLPFSSLSFQRQKDGYRPGDYGFDPLGLYSFRSSFGIDRIDEKLTREEKIQRAKFDMELCEVSSALCVVWCVTQTADSIIT
jgi:hypothetical protein